MADSAAAPKIEYGVTPTHVMASMSGLDFVRGIFEGKFPAPPIMQTVEPYDQTAEAGHIVFHSMPGFRHYNPIGSVHGGYAAILLDSAMGLAVQTTLPAGTHHRRERPPARTCHHDLSGFRNSKGNVMRWRRFQGILS